MPPPLVTSATCASMHMPQPLMALTARLISSKSTLSIPGLPMMFMRRLAGIFAYSGSFTRCVKR